MLARTVLMELQGLKLGWNGLSHEESEKADLRKKLVTGERERV